MCVVLPPGADTRRIEYEAAQFLLRLGGMGWCKFETLETATGQVIRLRLRKSLFAKLSPGFDTLALRQRLLKSMARQDDALLVREIWIAMLSAPIRMDFANLDELLAAVAQRQQHHKARQLQSKAQHWHCLRPPSPWGQTAKQ